MIVCLLLLAAVIPQDADRALTGSQSTKHFTIRYRPGSRAGAAVDRVAAMAERELARILDALEMKPEAGFELHLYDDIAELIAVTRTRGTGGFSAGNAAHLAYDDDQTRFHEMVHLVAHRLPKTGPETRNLFFAEGLSNAILEYVHGVHVHAVAAFEAKRASLPAVAEMTGAPDFYKWMEKRPDLNAYDVAGSYFRFLLDTHGVDKVVRYYTGTTAKDAFGATEGDLEGAWRKHLVTFDLKPEVAMLLRRRRGEDVRFAVLELDPDKRLPVELLGKPGDWRSVMPETPGAQGWKRDGAAVEGVSDSHNWNVLPLGPRLHKNAVVRARIKPVGRCVGIQLQLGNSCQAMLTEAGTFVWCEGVKAQDRSERLAGRAEIDLVMERRGRDVTIWIDGFKILQGVASDETAIVGLGVAGGTARFENVRVRELK